MFRTAGQTLWAWQCDDGEAGMAWDWIELGQGVVAMADPMAVVTNLRLVGDEGEALDRFASARHINGIVHQLPWRGEVQRLLTRLSQSTSEPGRPLQRPGVWQRPSLVGVH